MMLDRIQKLATLQITGGFTSTPTITLDTLAGLMPIDLNIEFIATKTAIRLKIDDNWVGNYNTNIRGKTLSHAYYLDKKLSELKLLTFSNTNDMTTNTIFDHKYTVNHATNVECIKKIQNIKPDDITIYTDGSLIKDNKKQNSLSGAGFTVIQDENIRHEQSYSLGEYTSINQCELFAINAAANWIMNTKMSKKNIFIFTDSKSTMHKLENGLTRSKLTLQTVNLLNDINLNNHIEIIKVPAHIGVDGNERADMLAKQGANYKPVGPEPFLSFTLTNIINELHNALRQKQIKKITDHKIKDKNKTPIINYLLKYGRKVLFKDKKQLTILTNLLSDQIHLASNDNHRDELVVPYCRHCKDIRETAEHFITTCPAYSLQRMIIFGHPTIQLQDLCKIHNPKDIVKFANDTNRLKDNYVCYYID